MLVNADVDSQSEEEEGETDIFQDDQEYLVERILDEGRRIINGLPCWAYKIKWEGYSEDEATWEPKANISHCKAVIKQWEDTVKQRRAEKQAKQKPAQLVQPTLSQFLSNTSTSRETNSQKWQTLIDDAEHRITIQNNVDDEGPPKNFEWSEVIHYGKLEPDTNFAMGCNCKGGACGPSCGCIGLTNEANQEERANYRAGRLVRKDARGGIFECNHNCTCDESCTNRVVQKGRRIPLELFKTETKGWGVRTPTALKAGTFVTRYTGELLTSEQADERGKKAEKAKESPYLFDIDFHCDGDGEDEEVFTLDARYKGNVGRFLNHSCDPNCRIYPVALDTADPRYYHIAVFTRQDIKAGEELTIHYAGGGHDEDPEDDEEMEEVVSVRKSLGRRSAVPVGSKRKATNTGGKKALKVAKKQKETPTRKKEAKKTKYSCSCGAANCTGVMPFTNVNV